MSNPKIVHTDFCSDKHRHGKYGCLEGGCDCSITDDSTWEAKDGGPGGKPFPHSLQLRGEANGEISGYCGKPECHYRCVLDADVDLPRLTQLLEEFTDHIQGDPKMLLKSSQVVEYATDPEVTVGDADEPTIACPSYLVRALTIMLATAAKKRADYAGNDKWSNFRATSAHFEIPLYEAGDFNEIQKLSRLATLRRTGARPQNEPVLDTYKDKAVFALLAFAMYLDVTEPPEETP